MNLHQSITRLAVILALLWFPILKTNGQEALIDKSFGFDGSCPILGDQFLDQYNRQMTIDSAGNIYVSFGYDDIGGDGYLITKIEPIGRVDNSFGDFGVVKDTAQFHKEGFLFNVFKLSDEATRITVYDEDVNYIARYIVPGSVQTQDELRYDKSGYLIGSTNEAVVFKYLSTGAIDQSFGDGGGQDFTSFFPSEVITECNYEYTKKNGHHICSVRTLSNYYIVEMDKDGNQIKHNVISAYMNDLASLYLAKDITRVMPLPDDRLVIYCSGKYDSNINNSYFMFIIDSDFNLDKDFGIEGLRSIPPGIKARIVVGGLSNGNILLKDPTEVINSNDISFCKIALINRKGEFREDINNYDQIAIRDAYAQNNSYIITDKNDFYVLSFNPFETGAYVTKFTLDNITTSTNDLQENALSQFSLFPNPAASHSNLHYTGPTLNEAILKVHTPSGQLMTTRKIGRVLNGDQMPLQTANYTTGNYIVSLYQENQWLYSEVISICR